VHVTVASGAGWSDGRMEAELQLVKAGLLYGDHATLASIGAAGVAAARDALSGSPEQKRDVLIDVASMIVSPDQRALFQLLRHPDAKRLPGYADLMAGLDPILGEADGVIGGFLDRSGLGELEPAERAGLLTIDSLGIDPVEFLKSSVGLAAERAGGEAAAAGARFDTVGDGAAIALMTRILDLASPGGDSYPLFDAKASGIIRSAIREAGAVTSSLPAAEAALTNEFVRQLPAFPEATVAEVLDARRAVEPALHGFRAAMTSMALELRTQPWDTAFKHESRALYASRVVPALDRIDSDMRDAGVFELTKHAAGSVSPWGAASASIVIAFTAAPVMPDLAALALSVGTSLAASVALLREMVVERNRLNKDVQSNQFVWLYLVGESLR
jgi:hypothetical protein